MHLRGLRILIASNAQVQPFYAEVAPYVDRIFTRMGLSLGLRDGHADLERTLLLDLVDHLSERGPVMERDIPGQTVDTHWLV